MHRLSKVIARNVQGLPSRHIYIGQERARHAHANRSPTTRLTAVVRKEQALVLMLYSTVYLTTRCPRRPVAPATKTCDGFAVIATVAAVSWEFRRVLVDAARARPSSGEDVRPPSPKADTAPRPEAAATSTRRVFVAVVAGLATSLRVLPL